jgi:hypothetical protein
MQRFLAIKFPSPFSSFYRFETRRTASLAAINGRKIHYLITSQSDSGRNHCCRCPPGAQADRQRNTERRGKSTPLWSAGKIENSIVEFNKFNFHYRGAERAEENAKLPDFQLVRPFYFCTLTFHRALSHLLLTLTTLRESSTSKKHGKGTRGGISIQQGMRKNKTPVRRARERSRTPWPRQGSGAAAGLLVISFVTCDVITSHKLLSLASDIARRRNLSKERISRRKSAANLRQ